MTYLLLLLGFVLLVKGADYFVSGSSAIAGYFHIPAFIIGLTVVALGTSLPEAAISVTAALRGANGITIGNALGSNLFNLLVVLGAASVIKTCPVSKSTLRFEYPLSIFAAGLILLLCVSRKTSGFVLSRLDGLVLLAVLAVFLVTTVRRALAERQGRGGGGEKKGTGADRSAAWSQKVEAGESAKNFREHLVKNEARSKHGRGSDESAGSDAGKVASCSRMPFEAEAAAHSPAFAPDKMAAHSQTFAPDEAAAHSQTFAPDETVEYSLELSVDRMPGCGREADEAARSGRECEADEAVRRECGKDEATRRGNETGQDSQAPQAVSLPKGILFTIAGAAAILFGGDIVVDSATAIAETFDIDETLIGLTVVAFGTSLPELVTSIVAAAKGETDIAVGNVIGSNLFNLLMVLGLSVSIHPIQVSLFAVYDLSILILASVIVLIPLARKQALTRGWGILLLVLYGVYLAYIIMRTM